MLLNASLLYSQDDDQSSKNNKKLKAALKKYPQADINKDGILTMKEAKEFKKNKKNKNSAQEKNGAAKNEMSEKGVLKIQYGDHEDEYFLLWLKETSAKRPIVIWAHQGGGHPRNFEDEASVLNSMDVHALSWGTQEKGAYTTMEKIDSLANAVLDWVIANGDEYKIDANQIIISGQSRGSGYSWHLCFRGYSGIKGIYMANGLGKKVSKTVNLTGKITSDAPPIFFTWKPGAGLDGDVHTQDGAIAVRNKYKSLGIGARVLGYELDNKDLYQHLPDFIRKVLNW